MRLMVMLKFRRQNESAKPWICAFDKSAGQTGTLDMFRHRGYNSRNVNAPDSA
jgi:hypothetical protein